MGEEAEFEGGGVAGGRRRRGICFSFFLIHIVACVSIYSLGEVTVRVKNSDH